MQTKARATGIAMFVAGALALGSAPPAFAQPAASAAAKATARKDYKAAEGKFDKGDFAGALKLYEAAEAVVPVPQTKYKIGACHDKLGHVADALRWYQIFLDNVPPEKADKLAPSMNDARARMSVLKATPATVRLVIVPANAPIIVSVDGAPPQGAGSTLSVPPGHHRLVFQAQGFDPAASDVDVGPADAKEVRLTLQPSRPGVVAVIPPPPPPPGAAPAGPVAPPPPPPTPSPRRSNVPAYVLIGAAGAGIVAGSVLGALALKDKSDFNANPTNAGADKTHAMALGSDISFAIGGALGITGIVLLVTNLPPRGSERAFITPYVGPTGAGATARVSF
jgi:hypothetical protein